MERGGWDGGGRNGKVKGAIGELGIEGAERERRREEGGVDEWRASSLSPMRWPITV